MFNRVIVDLDRWPPFVALRSGLEELADCFPIFDMVLLVQDTSDQAKEVVVEAKRMAPRVWDSGNLGLDMDQSLHARRMNAHGSTMIYHNVSSIK